jgi:hypothetical protein
MEKEEMIYHLLFFCPAVAGQFVEGCWPMPAKQTKNFARTLGTLLPTLQKTS